MFWLLMSWQPAWLAEIVGLQGGAKKGALRTLAVMQDVRFDRNGDVYFQEYVYFTPHPDSCSKQETGTASNAAGGYKGADSDVPPSEQVPQCFETDELVTLNLPLIGVLKVVDNNAWQIRHLIDLAIQRFFYANRGSAKFNGLFMRRCVASPYVHAAIDT